MNPNSIIIISFIAGLIVGSLLLWLLLPARRNRQRLEEDKRKAEEALKSHKQQVDAHFVKTAELVNKMTQAYRDVHEHLAESAQDLCSEENKSLVMDKARLAFNDTPDDSDAKITQQPLDYAPSSKGTLSEDFGLEKTPVEEAPAPAEMIAPRDYADTGDNADSEQADKSNLSA